MKRVAYTNLRSRLSLFVLALLIPITCLVQQATAQDPAAQAAQQASDAAQRAAQQASQQAQQDMQTAQRAAQQAAQDAQTAAMNNTPYSTSQAQQPPPALPSLNTPVPQQIRAAHTIFLANDGAAPNFPIDANTAYEGVYSGLKAWGHYQLADSAQQADLLFQLRGVAPITNVSGNGNGVYSSTSPGFELSIRDPKTNTRLWTVTSPVYVAGNKSKRAYWQNVDIANLVSRVKVLAGQGLTPAESANLTTYPKAHSGRTVVIATAVVAGAAAGGALALHAAFNHSVADQKAQQDAFCQAHNIPMSQCAGG